MPAGGIFHGVPPFELTRESYGFLIVPNSTSMCEEKSNTAPYKHLYGIPSAEKSSMVGQGGVEPPTKAL